MEEMTVDGKKKLHISLTRYNPKADTHDKKLKLRHYLLGRMAFQCFQAMKKLDAICIAIMYSDLYSKRVITTDAISFFASDRIDVIFTDFKENWTLKLEDEKNSKTIINRFSRLTY